MTLVRDHLLIYDAKLHNAQQRFSCAQAHEFLLCRTATLKPAQAAHLQANTSYVATCLVVNALGHLISVPVELIQARWAGNARQVPADTVSVAAMQYQTGHYAVTFSVGSLGEQHLSLQLDGRDIPGSPFALNKLVRDD